MEVAEALELDPQELLKPFVPRLVVNWILEDASASARDLDGTLAYVDISGFTSLTERLARRGRVGAEELSDVLSACFSDLLDAAYVYGAGLVKWGGDALFLLFDGPGHARRACRAVVDMRSTLRTSGRLETSAGRVTLRMSAGVNSGRFLFFLVGDLHRELVVVGRAATLTARMQEIATVGEIVVSPATAAGIDPSCVGEPRGEGLLLRSAPAAEPDPAPPVALPPGADLSQCLPVGLRGHLLLGSEPEHRGVTVSFVDYTGIGAVLERDGVDGLETALGELMSTAQRECARHGVTFWETDIGADGGKIMLVAGAPVTSGNDEERILRTVRRIVDTPSLLTLRAGVNSGHVFLGEVGPSYRRTASVKGDAVNLAARLAQRAAPGEILVAAAVSERSPTRFATEAIEPFMVKGKSKPVEAVRLGQPEAIRGTGGTGRVLPLVGRERELETLMTALRTAAQGTGAIVELVADPGIGKSRLLEELARQADGFMVRTATCDEYEAGTPYHALAPLLSSVVGLEAADAESRGAALRELVLTSAPALEPWLPLVGIPFGLQFEPTSEVDWLDEQFRSARLGDAIVDLLEAVVEHPLLLLLEDVHWLDDASCELLRRICRAAANRPWLVGTTRQEAGTGFRPDDLVATSIALEPLSEQAARSFVEESSTVPLAAHVVAALTARAGGNPLFLSELASAAQTSAVDSLPQTLEALLAAQIDRLPTADRTILRLASVLGTSIDEQLLAEVLDIDGVVIDETAWDRLDAYAYRVGPGELRFRNPLVRDTAYEGLPYRRRRALHARAGAALEQRSGGRPEEHAALLSIHFFHAQLFERAWHYALLAGEQAQAVYANVEAAELYERAIEAGRRTPGATHALGETAEKLGDVRHLLGDYARAADAYRAAGRRFGDDPVARARLSYKQARIWLRLKRYSDGLRALSRGLRLLESAQGKETGSVRAQLTVRYAALRQEQGRYREAVRWCERAIEVAQAAGDRDALAHAYYLLDWAYVALGKPEEARYSPLALEIYEELGNVGGLAVVYNNLGGFAYLQGRWDEAIELYERGREARERTGDPVNAAYGTSNIAEILSDRGQLDEARQLLAEALRVWQAAGYRFGIAWAWAQLARVDVRAGQGREALELYARARAEFVDIGARGSVDETDARVAEALLLAGDAQGARARVEAKLAELGPNGRPGIRPLLHRVLGCTLASHGELDEAVEALEESIRFARELSAEYDLALSLEALGAVLRLRRDNAKPFETESAAILERLGAAATTATAPSTGLAAT